MIDQTQHTGRTRPYTYPEVLAAIGHTLKRPGHQLATPQVKPLYADHINVPAAELTLDDNSLTSTAGWARVLRPGAVVLAIRTAGLAVMVSITGRLSAGPLVRVIGWVMDWPLELPGFATQHVAVSDLLALADMTTGRATDSLAGAR